MVHTTDILHYCNDLNDKLHSWLQQKWIETIFPQIIQLAICGLRRLRTSTIHCHCAAVSWHWGNKYMAKCDVFKSKRPTLYTISLKWSLTCTGRSRSRAPRITGPWAVPWSLVWRSDKVKSASSVWLVSEWVLVAWHSGRSKQFHQQVCWGLLSCFSSSTHHYTRQVLAFKELALFGAGVNSGFFTEGLWRAADIASLAFLVTSPLYTYNVTQHQRSVYCTTR